MEATEQVTISISEADLRGVVGYDTTPVAARTTVRDGVSD